MPTKW